MTESLTPLLACSTCGFDRTGQIGAAADGSVLFLLAVVFFMFGILAYVIFYFAHAAQRAAALQAASTPPSVSAS